MNISNELKIANWSEQDRPREKLLEKGKATLSDAELLAIQIGSGTRELNAVDLAKLILKSVNNDLSALAKMNVKELTKFKGIGEAKAINILSALELGRRRKDFVSGRKPKIQCSRDAFNALQGKMLDLRHEEFWILLLNRGNTIIDSIQLSNGGVSGTVVDSKILFKHATEKLASGIILAHNHPSGNLTPSQADKTLTKKLHAAGDIMDIPILDHLIITDDGYFSFADEGLLTL